MYFILICIYISLKPLKILCPIINFQKRTRTNGNGILAAMLLLRLLFYTVFLMLKNFRVPSQSPIISSTRAVIQLIAGLCVLSIRRRGRRPSFQPTDATAEKPASHLLARGEHLRVSPCRIRVGCLRMC